ncbi:MAG: type II toxin-antitoxin system HicB family antitoxin [Acidimicrobiales bacterium]
MSDHAINMFWSEEDRAWVADIPDLQHCSALGATPQEALAEVLHAKTAWLDSAGEHGDAIPEPRYRPAIYAAGSRG